MKLIKRLIILGFLAIVLLVIAVGVGAMVFIDAAAKKGIEFGANKALGVPTTLNKASVGLFSGTFAMNGLNIGNPQGFPSDHFLNLGDAKVAVTLSSLTKDTIEIPEFTMDTMDVRLERRNGKSNYQVILDNIQKLTGGDKGATQPKPKEPSQGPEKKLIVKQVNLKNITVHADMVDAGTPGLSNLAAVTVPIPEIRLENVGQTGSGVGGSGVTISQLSGIIVQAIMAAVVEKGGVLPEQLLTDLKGQLGSLGGLKGLTASFVTDKGGTSKPLGEQFGAAVGNLNSTTKNAVNSELDKLGPQGDQLKDAAGKEVDKATDKLKGLLGKPKDPPKPDNPKPDNPK
jgi:hypothetical protein